MKLGFIAAVLLVALSVGEANAGKVCAGGFCYPVPFGADSVAHGVACEVNKVALMAKDERDCKTAGGMVTHTLTTVSVPVKNDEAVKPKAAQ